MVAELLCPKHYNWWIAEVKNYNLNVTEVRYPAFPMLFPGIFNFTVRFLTRLDYGISTDSIAIGQMRPRSGLIGPRLVQPEPFRTVHGFNHFDSVRDFCISCALKVLEV